MSNQILMVEDDEGIAEAVRVQVEELGFTMDLAINGKAGLEKALEQDYVLILLDLMLPELGGMEICKRIRESGDTTPIIMLTAKGEELDRVLGLELGADDYLTKPFSVRELTARINAQLRRQGWEEQNSGNPGGVLDFGSLVIESASRIATLNGQKLDLTPTEFALLLFLAEKPGETYTRAELLENVWDTSVSEYANSVNTLVSRIRNKIEEDPSNPRFIKTVRGYGYRFAKPDELDDA